MKKWLVLLLVVGVISCGGGEGKTTLRIGHNHTQTNPSHLALEFFAQEVEQRTNGEVKIQIFPNGTLGDDRIMLEQVQQGSLDMVRVNSATLENFDDNFALFSMPYLFKSEQHFYDAMDADVIKNLYTQRAAQTDLRILSYQDTGVRSFYTKRPIRQPDDLRGLKIRVLSSQNLIRMMDLFGATATPLPYGEVYMALQQGMIDGAENNVQALTLDKHGEVATYYNLNNHLRLPDFLVIGQRSWNKLSTEQQEIIQEAAHHAMLHHRQLWNSASEQAFIDAQAIMGVEIIEVDSALFRERVEPMYEQLASQNATLYQLTRTIESLT